MSSPKPRARRPSSSSALHTQRSARRRTRARLRARGKSTASLLYLDAAGVQTAWKSPHWSASTVGKVLTNRAYLGEARQGDIVNPTAHERLVTEKQWQAVQPGKRIVLPNEARRSASVSSAACSSVAVAGGVCS